MKIAVVGPGATGCLLAALLARLFASEKNSRDTVWLLDKHKDRAEKISQQGILIAGLHGEFRVKIQASAVTQEIGIADLVIITVKSYHTQQAILHAKPLVGKDTAVLTLQNGIGNIETIQEAVGQDKVIGGVTNLGATLVDVGQVIYAGKGETAIGRMDGKIPAILRSIREIFNRAGLETRISRDIKGALWSKLIINAGINALTAITGLKNGRLIEAEETRRILRQAVTEAIRVAKRKKIKLLYDDPLAKVEAVCVATSENISSMLQDVMKNKVTEIDYINGVVVRQGQELGIPVAVNATLTDLVKTIERNYHRKVK